MEQWYVLSSQGGFQLLVSVYDDDLNSDDHVDDVYAERSLSPGSTVSQVREGGREGGRGGGEGGEREGGREGGRKRRT